MQGYSRVRRSFRIAAPALLFFSIFQFPIRDALGKERKTSNPILIRVETARQIDSLRKVKAVGILNGKTQIDLYSRVSGTISWLGVREGEAVKKGQILVKVDRSDPGQTFIPTPLISPIDGWIGRLYIAGLGVQVNPQEPIMTILDDKVLTLKVGLPQRDWELITHDTPVYVIHRDSNIQLKAKIATISRLGTGLTSRGIVTIEVETPYSNDNQPKALEPKRANRPLLKAGTPAYALFELDKKPRLLVPASALSLTEAGSFIFTISGTKATRKPVLFEPLTKDQIEILSGLDEGSQIVTEGVHLLRDGSEIKIDDKSSKKEGQP